MKAFFVLQEAESLAAHVEEGVMYEPLPNAQLLQPPVPVYPSDTAWPLLTVAKVRELVQLDSLLIHPFPDIISLLNNTFYDISLFIHPLSCWFTSTDL